MTAPTPLVSAKCPLRVVEKLFLNLWLFTKDDFFTFVFPNTIFGVCVALSGPVSVSAHPSVLLRPAILARIPWVVAFNWTNLLVFDLSNQWLWESVLEDRLNKSWRPIPSNRITRSEVRQALQLVIPAVLAFNHYVLHVGSETACIMVGSWVYNELKASDDSFLIRNAVIALGSGIFNWSSLKVAIKGRGSPYSATTTTAGYVWICMYSAVIFTTMHIQDMKDQVGDTVTRHKF